MAPAFAHSQSVWHGRQSQAEPGDLLVRGITEEVQGLQKQLVSEWKNSQNSTKWRKPQRTQTQTSIETLFKLWADPIMCRAHV